MADVITHVARTAELTKYTGKLRTLIRALGAAERVYLDRVNNLAASIDYAIANIDDTIAELKDAYDTLVTELGAFSTNGGFVHTREIKAGVGAVTTFTVTSTTTVTAKDVDGTSVAAFTKFAIDDVVAITGLTTGADNTEHIVTALTDSTLVFGGSSLTNSGAEPDAVLRLVAR